jgi:hypothetical protein
MTEASARLSEAFQGGNFVLLRAGAKFPPIEKGWQNKPHSFEEAAEHSGNVGILAGNGFVGLDHDRPDAFDGLSLPKTTKWETRPGRFGMIFKCDDVTSTLLWIGEPVDRAQFVLKKDGLACGEIKLSRSYQVIPPSWKSIDGERVDYLLRDDCEPAEISLSWLLSELEGLGISTKKKLEDAKARLEEQERKARQNQGARMAEDDGDRQRRYALVALESEARELALTPEGARNSRLNTAAYKMAGYVSAGVLTEGDVVEALRTAALKTGLPEEEIVATLQSGLDAGMLSPREIPERSRAKNCGGTGPSIKTVSKDDPIGLVGLNPSTGEIVKVATIKVDDEELKGFAWLSDCAIWISTETRSGEETEFVFEGVGAVDKRRVRFTMPAAHLADTQKFKAALLNAFGAKNRIGKLDFPMVQSLTRNPRLRQRFEVPDWHNGIPMVPGMNLVEEVEFRLSPMTPARVYDGNIEQAKVCLRKFLGLHRYSPILLTGVLGAPAVARWYGNDRYGIGLWGLTGTMKTTVAQMALSVYGTGYQDDEALLKHGKAGATQVGAMEVLAAAGMLPQIIDNVKTVDEKDSQLYISIIHATIEGRDRLRGRKEGGLRESRSFLCTPIITGEIRPEEAATSARVLNLSWTRPEDLTDLSYLQANVHSMPVVGYHWLKFIAQTNLDMRTGFDEARSRKMTEFTAKHFTNPGRLATIYTLLSWVWNLLRESPWGDVFEEFTPIFRSVLDEAIETQGGIVTSETEIERFIRGVRELIASDSHLIQDVDVSKTIVGKSVIGKWTNDGLFLMPSETMAALGRLRIFAQVPTVDSITRSLASVGMLIEKDVGRHQVRVRVNGQRVRGWLVPSPVVEDLSPVGGDSKNDGSKCHGSGGSGVPAQKRERNLGDTLEREEPSTEAKKHNACIGGDSGPIGPISSIDDGFNGSSSVPTNHNDGDKVNLSPGWPPSIAEERVLAEVIKAEHEKHYLQKAEGLFEEKLNHIKKTFVRFLKPYRSQFAVEGDSNRFIDRYSEAGDVAELSASRAADLIKRGIAEPVDPPPGGPEQEASA